MNEHSLFGGVLLCLLHHLNWNQIHGKLLLSLSPDFNKNVSPPSEPTEVNIGLRIFDVSKIDDEEHSLRLKLGITFLWNDTRVNLRGNTFPPSRSNWTSLGKVYWLFITLIHNCHEKLLLFTDISLKKRIWIPSLTSSNLREFVQLKNIQSTESLRWTPFKDFRLFYETYSLVTFSCSMNFNQFPFDKHICKLQVTKPKSGAS